MKKLDKIDLKILQILDFNGRMPISQIAKEVNLKKKTTEYRIKKLEKENIICGYYPVINFSKFGKIYCKLFLTLHNISKEERENLIQKIKENEKVFWMFKLSGKYDLGIGFLCENLTKFKFEIEKIEEKFRKFIKNKNESFATKLYSLEYEFVNKKSNKYLIYQEKEKEKIDEIDYKILKELAKNSRQQLVEIAIKLNQSAKVISYRIKQMQKKEIIQGFRTIINYEKLNLAYYKILMNVNLEDKNNLEELKKYLISHPIVIYYVKGIGNSYNLDFEILVKSNQELFNFIEEIRFKFPKLISDYETIGFLETLKVNFVPEIKF